MQVSTNHPQVRNLGLIERWALILGGVYLMSYGVKKGSALGKLMTFLGGDMVYSGIIGRSRLYNALGLRPKRHGRSATIPYQQGIRVDASVIIEQPLEEVYSFWRRLENLPRFMRHLRSVTTIDHKHSHWVAEGPAGKPVEWNAEIINDQPGELIAWRSLPGSEVDTAGSVHFKPVAGNRATRVLVELQYLPPAGIFGAAFTRLMGNDPARQIREDLQRLQHVLKECDKVQEASEESFPASDPPSWNA
jgi:uncharacterized membrane protein